MKVTIVATGRAKRGPWRELLALYEDRLSRFCRLTVVELPEARGEPHEARAREGAAIAERLARVPAGGRTVVALDERGTELTSDELAALVDDAAARGHELVFVIGSHAGLDDAVLAAADRRLSLGRFTLPHLLARLVLTEQLYRAFTMLRNHPYHRA